jgi:hypothetical protein
MVRQANMLEASGQFMEAAQQFAHLADGAAQAGMPDRAGNLLLRSFAVQVPQLWRPDARRRRRLDRRHDCGVPVLWNAC